MSWISDFIGDAYGNQLNSWASGAKQFGLNDVASFIKAEADKGALRGAQVEGFASGLPIVGGIIKGVNNVEQMEDLYNNTGRVSAYPGVQSSGLSSAGKSIPGLARKIEEGTHDLFEHYAGVKDNTLEALERSGIMETGDKFVARNR